MENKIDELFSYFNTKCPNYIRHKYDPNNKCIKCGIINGDPSWKYTTEGKEYCEKYMILFLISSCKKNIMSILNKITLDTYNALSEKFSAAILDIKYMEQAVEIADQFICKIINEKFIKLYASLCKIITDKNSIYLNERKTERKTFQMILINRLQFRYNLYIHDESKKRDMILLLLFICELLKIKIIPKSIIKKIMNTLLYDEKRNEPIKYYHMEVLCKMINSLSDYENLIRDCIKALSSVRNSMKNKNRIYILILNLEDDYSKKWKRKSQNEVKLTTTKKYKNRNKYQKRSYAGNMNRRIPFIK